MQPALVPGDNVLVRPSQNCSVGDIVVAKHPFRRDVWMIKQLSHVDAEGRLFLIGLDASESTDSRSLGAIDPSALVGVVTSVF